MAKLAALVPRPRHHLVRYHGVLAPNAGLRRDLVPARPSRQNICAASLTAGASDQSEPIRGLNQQGEPRAPLNWAERLRRVFRVDISNCPLCGGQLRVIGDVTDPTVIQRILNHVAAQPPPIRDTNPSVK